MKETNQLPTENMVVYRHPPVAKSFCYLDNELKKTGYEIFTGFYYLNFLNIEFYN